MTLAEKKRYAEMLEKGSKTLDVFDQYWTYQRGRAQGESGEVRGFEHCCKCFEKEEEEELVEPFLTLQIDESKAISPMQVEATDEDCTEAKAAEKLSTSNWPKKQSKITSFFLEA